jgi:hypothetical protein
MTYYYPIVTTGYRWNLLKRCFYEVGMEPTVVCDIGEQTALTFARELSEAEKGKLDTLMADNPQLPPTKGVAVQFTIEDIWEKFTQFRVAAGLPNLKLYYAESVPGSGNVDTIVLQHPTALTNTQKNNVKTAYNNLLKNQ